MNMIHQNTALLVMDMQAMVLAGLPDSKSLLQKVAVAISKARSNNIPVIFIVVGFRNGAPEINQNNKIFGGSKDRFTGIDLEAMLKVHPDLSILEEDVIVVKRRVSGFYGTDLEIVLKGQNIQHIILTGVATSGVVLSTLREAADKDFIITVLTDCCGDRDQEVHNVLITKIFPQQASVLRLDEWD